MANSKSHQTLVNLLQDSLHGSAENVYRDIVESKLVEDFFSEESVEESLESSAETIQIASFEIGNYKPEEVEWKVEDGSICIRGKRSRATTTGATGCKFCRCVPIPDNVNAKTVTARFCAAGGYLKVEGKKQRRPPPLKRKTSKTAFFGDSHFSLSVDLGDGTPVNTNMRSCEFGDKPKQEKIQLF